MDLKPVVKFLAKDNKGNIIPLNELTDCRFALTYLETPGTGSTARLIDYTTRVSSGATQATTDSARLTGLTQTNDGEFTYKFATVLPAGYSKSATHQLVGQMPASRRRRRADLPGQRRLPLPSGRWEPRFRRAKSSTPRDL